MPANPPPPPTVAFEPTVLDYIRAHQYLYYVKSTSVLRDYDYDMFVRWTCLDDGKGGSDLDSSYTKVQKRLGTSMMVGITAPFPPEYLDREKA